MSGSLRMAVVVASAALVLMSCTETVYEVVPVAQVEVTGLPAQIEAGQSVQLSARVVSASGRALSGRTVTWTSLNPSVATVSADGRLTAHAAGPASVQATCEGVSGSASTTVTPPPVASVSVAPPTATIQVGGLVQLQATPRAADGSALPDRPVTWQTSSAAIATVDGTGLVTGVGLGTATITATSEGRSGSAQVTVERPVQPIAQGDWSLSAGAGLSGWLNMDGDPARLTKLALGYDGWRCGGVTVDGWRTVTFTPPREVVDREVDLQLSFASGDTKRFQGRFDDEGRNLSGDWSATVSGQSCSGSWTAEVLPEGWVAGRMSFSYSGHRTGWYSVLTSFAVAAIDLLGTGTWAVSFYDTNANTQDLMAQRVRPDGLLDFVWLWVPGRVTAAGTREVVGGVLVLGYHPGNQTAQGLYLASSGSVSFTSVTGGRVGGSFTMAMQDEATAAALDVTGGSFDVPLVTDDQVLGTVASLHRPAGQILESVLRIRRGVP